MVITESSQNGAKILNLSGRFDFASRHVFQGAVSKAEESGLRHLILNLEKVAFMDSAALGMLATMHQQLSPKQIKVSLANPQDYVKKVLGLAKMDQLFSIHDSEEQAISSGVMA